MEDYSNYKKPIVNLLQDVTAAEKFHDALSNGFFVQFVKFREMVRLYAEYFPDGVIVRYTGSPFEVYRREGDGVSWVPLTADGDRDYVIKADDSDEDYMLMATDLGRSLRTEIDDSIRGTQS